MLEPIGVLQVNLEARGGASRGDDDDQQKPADEGKGHWANGKGKTWDSEVGFDDRGGVVVAGIEVGKCGGDGFRQQHWH